MKRVICLILTAGFLVAQNSSSSTFGVIRDALEFGYNLGPSSAKSIALTGSNLTDANDNLAFLKNPAALTSVKRIRLSSGLGMTNYGADATYLDNRNDASLMTSYMSHFAFVFPYPVYRGNLVFALAYNNDKLFSGQKDISAFDPRQNSFQISYLNIIGTDSIPTKPFVMDSVFRSEKIVNSGSLKSWHLSVGIDVRPDLSLGVGFKLQTGTLTSELTYGQEDILDRYFRFAPLDSIGEDIDKVSGIAKTEYNMDAAALLLSTQYRLNASWTLSGAVELPLYFDLSVKNNDRYTLFYDDEDVPPGEADFAESKSTYGIDYPIKISIGATYFHRYFRLYSSLKYADWGVLGFSGLENSALTNAYTDQNLTQEITMGFGGALSINPLFTVLYAGVNYSQYPDENYARDILKTGLGLTFNFFDNMVIDLGYSFYQEDSELPPDFLMPDVVTITEKRQRFLADFTYFF
jgi:hypothetical protein